MTKIFKDFDQAYKAMPACLIGACDDYVGITTEARRDNEDPMALLRNLVSTELDLIDEGEEAAENYTKRQVASIRRYHAKLCESTGYKVEP